MKLWHLPATLAAVLVMGGVSAVTAQQSAPSAPTTSQGTATATTYVEVEDDNLTVMPFNLTVDQVEDLDVYDAAGERIGEVEDVLANSSGDIAALSVEVGGFLGIGDRDAVVVLDELTLDSGRLVTNLGREEIEALPHWDD